MHHDYSFCKCTTISLVSYVKAVQELLVCCDELLISCT